MVSRGLAGSLLAALLACSPRAGIAHPRDPEAVKARLDAIASAYTPYHLFMGSALVVDGDQVLLDKGYGQADVEWSVPNTPGAKFRIGSMTKQFTAVLVLLLQQDGKLSIQDPVSKYLPEAPKSWKAITLAELLGHTSGIPDLVRDKDFPVWSASPHTWAEEFALFRDKPLDFTPGSRFEYSSSNYEVLGAIVEKVSAKPYTELLRERILGPLGMRESGLDTDELILPKRAQGYRIASDGSLVRARSESLSVPWAAGSMYSTTGDLLKWERGLFGGQLLSQASLKTMTTEGLGGYGLGVEVTTIDGLTEIHHGGAIEGYAGYLFYLPAQRITVAVLGNVQDLTPEKLARQLLSVTLGKPVVLPGERKAPIAKEDLDRFVGTYDLPGFSLTFRRDGDVLDSISDGAVFPTVYEGLQGGQPTFYVPQIDAEITFVADAKGAIVSMVLHQNFRDIPGRRQ